MLVPLVSSLAALATLSVVTAYEVTISDKDSSREVCSGMWAGSDTYINGMPTILDEIYAENIHSQMSQ